MRAISGEGDLKVDPDADADGAGSALPAIRVVKTVPFEEVYRENYPRLLRVAHLLSGSNEAAEDIVQDAFLGLYRRFGETLHTETGGYLYRSVVNGCTARHRHRRVLERVRHLTVQPETAPSSEIDETWSSVNRLSPRRRAVIILRFYGDRSIAEIAEILGCKVGTAKSLLHRALAQLKDVADHE